MIFYVFTLVYDHTLRCDSLMFMIDSFALDSKRFIYKPSAFANIAEFYASKWTLTLSQ